MANILWTYISLSYIYTQGCCMINNKIIKKENKLWKIDWFQVFYKM